MFVFKVLTQVIVYFLSFLKSEGHTFSKKSRGYIKILNALKKGGMS